MKRIRGNVFAKGIRADREGSVLTGDLSKRKAIRRAEELILMLRDIRSCRISADEDDEIAEIHVVADNSGRPPKLIARDVEGCLSAELGLRVDYRKIGVVIIDSDEEGSDEEPDSGTEFSERDEEDDLTAEDQKGDFESGGRSGKGETDMRDKGEYELEFLEEDSRIRFRGMNLKVGEELVDVYVKLEKDGVQVVGTADAVKQHKPFFKLIAAATLDAVTKLLDEKFHLCLSGIEQVSVSEREALVVSIQVVDEGIVSYLSGSAFIGRDSNEAAALAVLDAINRPFGRWKSRRRVHYKIR